jgi:hypothetical protein
MPRRRNQVLTVTLEDFFRLRSLGEVTVRQPVDNHNTRLVGKKGRRIANFRKSEAVRNWMAGENLVRRGPRPIYERLIYPPFTTNGVDTLPVVVSAFVPNTLVLIRTPLHASLDPVSGQVFPSYSKNTLPALTKPVPAPFEARLLVSGFTSTGSSWIFAAVLRKE